MTTKRNGFHALLEAESRPCPCPLQSSSPSKQHENDYSFLDFTVVGIAAGSTICQYEVVWRQHDSSTLYILGQNVLPGPASRITNFFALALSHILFPKRRALHAGPILW